MDKSFTICILITVVSRALSSQLMFQPLKSEFSPESFRKEVEIFDPNDCYEAGTIFEENEKNLGFCPCKYGYYGPLCFEIWDCAIGELRTDTCDKEFGNDYDLQWRCAASKKDVVKICTCPDGFRGETCEFILENTFATYWETAKQSQRFFEIVYNRSHSVVRLAGSALSKKILEHRRLIMIIIFFIIFQMAWIRVRRDKMIKRKCQQTNCSMSNQNSKEQESMSTQENWQGTKSKETWISMNEESPLSPLIDYEMLRKIQGSRGSEETFLTNSSSSGSSLRSEETENEENLLKESEITDGRDSEVPEPSNTFRVHNPCLHI